MSNLLVRLRLEPARVMGVVGSLATLIIFKLADLSEGQVATIMPILLLFVTEIIRGKVSPAVPVDYLHEVDEEIHVA